MRVRHKLSGVDLVAACRVFVVVAESASFTDGAAAVGVPQSVASRRIASLEAHLGRRLFNRTTRKVALTPFGEDVLPSARRLVQLAESFERDAARARLRLLTLAVPETCTTRDLVRLDVAASDAGTAIDLVTGTPGRRIELLRSRSVRSALVAVPEDRATWSVPLGVAGRNTPEVASARLASLRPSRARPATRRLWIQPEDDVVHVRDEVQRAGHRAGLSPAQVAVAPTLAAAASSALRVDDLLLCSPTQADELGLGWRLLEDPLLRRGHAVQAVDRDDASALTGTLWIAVARALGYAELPGGDGT